jgi:tetratricopeptide (TPR) repeat protein
MSRLLSSVVSARLWPRFLGACVIAGCLSAAPAARAQDDPTTTAAARERFKEGVAYFDKKEFEKARAAFLQAYALKKHPAVLLNLAQSEVRSGHERDAAKHFSQYLRETTDASPAERDAAQAGLATARAAIVEVALTVDETGADVSVDGQPEGTTPLTDPLFLDPGSHTIEAKKGDKVASQTVSGKAGERKDARLALLAPKTPVAAAAAQPEKPTEETGGESVDAEVTTGGREPFLRWVTTRPAGFIPAGATVLFGLGAGGFAIGSSIRYSDADSTAEAINEAAKIDDISTQGICVDPTSKVNDAPAVPSDQKADRIAQYEDACKKHKDYVDQGDAFKTVAIGLGVGAGVAAVATVVLYFTTAPKTGESAREEASAPSVAVVPWASPDSGGLAVFGQF